ncbi:MAG: ABC transporter ATP-binding protein [Clostridia bacterium]|nr:ABC transporter ATP-binding protein [Clostridia bacterium]
MKIHNLTKFFDKKLVFDNFSIEIPENKITVITGESGCGKTTLLRIIAGLDNSYKGEIIKESNKISYVFQEPRLFNAITVKQNLELVEKNTSLSIDEILTIVELQNDKNTYPNELSGGMKMRLSLARALYYNGDIFIFDEPFSALDNNMKNRIIPKVFDLIKGKTIIIVSHNADEISSYTDNLIKI